MRIVYLGTPDFAVLPLEKILNETSHEVVAVVTNPDRPVGRKQILTAPPVKKVALKRGIPVLQYEKIRLEGVEDLKNLKPDIMITCAFGQILSQEILDIAPFGVINIHASLLPAYRGASPIHFAILNGENETGITIMKTDVGIDTGDILLQQSLKIGDDETCGELFDRLSVLGADCIVKALDLIEKGQAKFVKQDDEKASHSKIIRKEMALIDWSKPAQDVVNQIRAFNPAPVAFTYLNGQPFKIYSAKVCDLSGKAGEILRADNELVIGCADKSISLIKVQKAGGNALEIADFLRGNKFNVGDLIG
ncbi:MAG: methionyl-tRNA formyltransferase [Clostridia bacterium]|nr:methionyl-tRNA formyltransferase [Clostridia bacterium]